jgi:hypothetical protein
MCILTTMFRLHIMPASTNPPTPNPTKSCRFLHLSAEIRLMIYKLLPSRTVRTTFTKPASGYEPASSFTFVTSCAQTAILSTCRLVNAEAFAIMDTKKDDVFAHQSAPRIQADMEALLTLSKKDGFFDTLRHKWAFHRANARTSLNSPLDGLLCEYRLVRKDGMLSDAEVLEAMLQRTTLLLARNASQPTVHIIVKLRRVDFTVRVSQSAFDFTKNLGSVARMRGISVAVFINDTTMRAVFARGSAAYMARAQFQNPVEFAVFPVRMAKRQEVGKWSCAEEEWL